MEDSKGSNSSTKAIILKLLLLLAVLLIGLYFGIRIGEGRYKFYQPDSPYYQKAVTNAENEGYSQGWDAAYSEQQKYEYNRGWSAGYEFCLKENKSIRNDYDEGWDDGYEAGREDGWSDGYDEARNEFSDD